MSRVRSDHYHSDIEQKFYNFLDSNLTDPISKRKPGVPFVVYAAQLRKEIQYPHVVVQIVNSPATRLGFRSKIMVKRPLLQISVFSADKKLINTVSDEVDYVMWDSFLTFETWGLENMEIEGDTKMPFDEEEGCYARIFEYRFVYHQITDV